MKFENCLHGRSFMIHLIKNPIVANNFIDIPQ